MDKNTAGCVMVLGLIVLQIIAWASGHNGLVFATISAIVGGIAGTLFGFTVGLKKGD